MRDFALSLLVLPLALALSAHAADAPATSTAAGHSRTVEVLRFSPDGALLASGSHDAAARLWDVSQGAPRLARVLEGHTLMVSDLAFAPDGQTLVTASWDGSARVWRIADGKLLHTLSGHAGVLHGVAIHPEGKLAATTGKDRTIRLWDLAKGEQVKALTLETAVPSAVAFRPDGAALAVGTLESSVLLYDAGSWAQTGDLSAAGWVTHLAYARDGSALAVGARSVTLLSPDGQTTRAHSPGGNLSGPFALAPDGRVLAAIARGDVLLYPAPDAEARKHTVKGETPTALAASPDGTLLAVGYQGGRIDLLDARTGEVTHTIARGASPQLAPAGPKGAPESLVGRDLMNAPADEALWTVRSDTSALCWRVPTEPSTEGATLAFRAAATPEHMVGRDYGVLPCELGTRPFDLTFDVAIDRLSGPGLFWPGMCIGLAPADPYAMGDEDRAAMMTVHFGGLYAGVRKGVPHRMRPDYSDILSPSLTTLVSGNPVPALGYSREARGTFSTGEPIRLRIRRDARNVLTFTAWCPEAGESPADPWWEGAWAIPPEHADMAFRYIFVQRVPVIGTHLGHQNTGYGDAIQLAGRLGDMRLALDPPAITAVEWHAAAVEVQHELVIRGAGFAEGATVRVGDLAAQGVERISDTELRARVPDLPAPGRYHVTVTNPNGTEATARNALPFGFLLESISLTDGAPAGGDVVTLKGSGFQVESRLTMSVWFGDIRAEIIEQPDHRTLRVRVPQHAEGTVDVSVTMGGKGKRQAHGTLRFAYTQRPSVWFTREELGAFRARSRKGPLGRYREAILTAADTALEQPVGRVPRHEAGNYVASLPWAYAVGGQDAQRDALLAWVERVLKENGTSRPHASFLAQAYDLLGTDMPPDLRQRVLQRLHTVLDQYVTDEASGEWSITNSSYTNARENAAAVTVALTLRNARPDAAAILAAATRHLTQFIEANLGPDGGCIDGLTWGNGGLADYLHAAHLLAKHTQDRSLLEHPRLANVRRLYDSMLATPARFMQFGDMHDGLAGIVHCAEIGSRTNDPLLLWVADTLAAKGGWAQAGQIGLAMYCRSLAPLHDAAPPLPTVSILRDMHWGVMRSAPALDAAYVLGVSGRSGVLSYHHQRDVASFQLYAHGEPVVLDPGWGSGSPTEHSLPIIDGQGGDSWGGLVTDTLSEGPWRAIVLDATPNRSPWGVKRLRRTFVMHTGGTVVILDDILPAEDQPGRVRAQLQVAPATLHPELSAATIPGAKASLTARFFGPAVELSTADRKRGQHWKGTWQALGADYTADPDRPLVTVLRMADGNTPGPIPEGVTYAPGEITVEVTQDDRVVFRRTEVGWGMVLPNGDGMQVLLTPAAPPPVPQAVCLRTDAPPTLDGKLDEAIWRKAPASSGFVVDGTWREDPGARHDTEVRFAYDDTHLYAAFRCHEPNLAGVRVSSDGPALGAGGDHLVLYVDPQRERTTNRYYGCVLTAGGRHLGEYGKVGDIGGYTLSVRSGREEASDGSEASEGEQGGEGRPSAWTLEVAIPWETLLHDPWGKLTLKGVPASGHVMGLNVQRYRLQEPAETSLWSRCHSWPTAVPWRWGTLRFE